MMADSIRVDCNEIESMDSAHLSSFLQIFSGDTPERRNLFGPDYFFRESLIWTPCFDFNKNDLVSVEGDEVDFSTCPYEASGYDRVTQCDQVFSSLVFVR